MKKLLFTFLAALCCMAMNAQTFEFGGINYSVTGENTVEVVKRDSYYSGTVVIPSAVTYSNTTYNVTGIGDKAFQDCFGLTSITIPCSVTSIGKWAIPVQLNSITVDSENPVYDSRNNCNAIIEKATNTLIYGCKNTIIPSDVTRIGNDAFRGCEQLISVTIPSSVTYIGNCAFMNCWCLTEIYVLATTPPELGKDALDNVPTGIPVYVPDVDAYKKISWGGFTNLIKNVDLPTAKKEAIADLQTFINKEKIANAPMEKYESSINAATAKKDIPSIVKNIKDGISNSDKFTLGEWKYLLDKNDEKYTIVGDKLTFTDKDFYQSGNNFTVDGSITYSRTFKNTNWQAWFMPFDMTITDELLSDYEFAKFAGTYTDAKGDFYLTIVKMKSDDILYGNRAYFIKAKSTGNKTITPGSTSIFTSSTSNHLEMYSAEQKIEVIGNYEEKIATADDCDWYAYGGGTYQKPSIGQSLDPMRFYLTITPRSDNYYAPAPAPFAKIDLMLIGDDGDEPTDINSISKPELSSGRMYNLNGQAVGNDFKGVVVKNGKKYINR